jgi:ParB family chromosome partitioning protein
MSALEPLLDVFTNMRGGTEQPASEKDLAAAEDSASERDAQWLRSIIRMAGGRDVTQLQPSVDALLAEAEDEADDEAGVAVHAGRPSKVRFVAIDELTLDGFQTRHRLDPDATARLAASIAEQGVLEPILVRPSGTTLQVVAGMRRLRAAKLVGLREVPVVVLELSDRDAIMVALVENLQREDLGALDEATCYFRLLDEFAWTQDDLARQIGRSRSHIGNTLRLLGLPAGVKAQLADGALSAGHARALLNADDPDALAAIVVAKGLSVRATEALVRRRQKARRTAAPTDGAFRRLEESLAARLGLNVRLHASGKGGRMTIYFGSADELDAALRAYGSGSGESAA